MDIETDRVIEEEVKFCVSYKCTPGDYQKLWEAYTSRETVRHIIKKCYKLGISGSDYLAIAETFADDELVKKKD